MARPLTVRKTGATYICANTDSCTNYRTTKNFNQVTAKEKNELIIGLSH